LVQGKRVSYLSVEGTSFSSQACSVDATGKVDVRKVCRFEILCLNLLCGLDSVSRDALVHG